MMTTLKKELVCFVAIFWWASGIYAQSSSDDPCEADCPVPECVANVFPVDGQESLTGISYLAWEYSPLADGYEVYLGNSVEEAALVTNTAGTWLFLDELSLPSGTYYWYVVPRNGVLAPESCKSTATSFVLLEPVSNSRPCDAVSLTLSGTTCNAYSDASEVSTTSMYRAAPPAFFAPQYNCPGIRPVNANVWFRFTATETAYHTVTVNPVAGINTSFRVFRVPDGCGQSFFPVGCYDTGGVAEKDNAVVLTEAGIEYYIQVFNQDGSRGIAPPGNSQFDICVTKTVPVCSASLPVLPADGANGIDHLAGFLRWNVVTGATGYDLYVGATPQTMEKVDYQVLQTSGGMVTLSFSQNFAYQSPFAPGLTYHWKVVPRNADLVNHDCTGETRSFTTSGCPLIALVSPIVTGSMAGELSYVIPCPNCPAEWFVVEYGPVSPGGTGTNPAPGNFVIHPAPLQGRIDIDNVSQIATYRYYFRSTGCAGLNTSLLPFDPGTPPQLQVCQASAVQIADGEGRWDFSGQYPVNSNGNSTPGKMAWFSFTPPTDGVYYLEVVESADPDEELDYLYKPDHLDRYSPEGWTGIGAISKPGKYAIGYLTAGTPYHFVADRRKASLSDMPVFFSQVRQSVRICKAEVALPETLNTCIEGRILNPIPAMSLKEEFAIDDNGRLILSIIPGTEALGTMNVSYYVNGNTIRSDNTHRAYLDRNFTITSSLPVSSPVQVKLFFTNGEVTDLLNASEDEEVTSVDDLAITKTGQSCAVSGILNPAGSKSIQPMEAGEYDATASYLCFSVSSFSSFYIMGGINPALPVRLLSFSGRRSEYSILLNWEAVPVGGFSHFEIEHSIDAFQFTSIGRVYVAGIGNQNVWSFTDEHPELGISYYRLKMIETDGSYSHSSILAIVAERSFARMTVAPNPIGSGASVMHWSDSERKVRVEMVSIDGKVLIQEEFHVEKGMNRLDFRAGHLPPGVYLVRVTGNGGTEVLRVIK